MVNTELSLLFTEEETGSDNLPQATQVVNDGTKIRTRAQYVKDTLPAKHTSHEYE